MSKSLSDLVKLVEPVIEKMTDQAREDLSHTFEISITELCTYQEAKSLAFAQGKMSQENAMFLYNALNSYSSQSLATKYIIARTMVELLKPKDAK